MTKGLFKKTLTDVDLHKLLGTALTNPAKFVKNARGYYEKTFRHAGVGLTSDQAGALPAQYVTLVINAGGDVVTMYPH